MKIQEIILNAERDVKLTALIQAVGGEFEHEKRPAVLVLPGGGYSFCSDREAEPVAFAYAQAGYQAFILRYSVDKHKKWPNPLNDYEQAMELIKNTEEWHVYDDRIAVIGFSAGGHLAACAATMAKNRPNAAILGYAVLSKEVTHVYQREAPTPVEEVDDKTCPCFLFGARDDRLVPITDTLSFQIALSKKDISFESHIYAYGQHGFSTGDKSLNPADGCSRLPNWVRDSVEWLADVFGEYQDRKLSSPACPNKHGDNPWKRVLLRNALAPLSFPLDSGDHQVSRLILF